MRVVHVAHLETGAIAAQTTGAKCRQTTFVRYLRQRIGLVHKLRQRIRAKIGIDNRRNRLRVNQIDRRKHLIITHIHAFANSTTHAGQTHIKLLVQLFAHRAHTTIAQVVNIIDLNFRIDKLNQIFDNSDNVLFFKHMYIDIIRLAIEQFAVDAIATHFAQVVAFFGEEQTVHQFARRSIVGRFGITQLTINMQHGFTFRVTRVFLERIVDDGKIIHILSLFMQQDCLIARLDDVVDMRGFEHCFTVNKHFRTLYASHLAGIFIDKIFRPFFQHTDSQFTPKIFF